MHEADRFRTAMFSASGCSRSDGCGGGFQPVNPLPPFSFGFYLRRASWLGRGRLPFRYPLFYRRYLLGGQVLSGPLEHRAGGESRPLSGKGEPEIAMLRSCWARYGENPSDNLGPAILLFSAITRSLARVRGFASENADFEIF